MPHPCPHHCPPERSGKAVLAVLAVIVIGAALARPAVRAAETVLEVAAITIGVVLGLAVVAGVVVIAVRATRRERPALEARTVRVLPPTPARAIEPPRQAYGTTYEHREAQATPTRRTHDH